MAMGLLLGMVTFSCQAASLFCKLGLPAAAHRRAASGHFAPHLPHRLQLLPYSANLTLRQILLHSLLAGVGVNSGHTFMATIAQGGGGIIFLAAPSSVFLQRWLRFSSVISC